MTGDWTTIPQDGYTVKMVHFSNKGPIFVIEVNGKEISRARFDLATRKWTVLDD